MHARTPLTSIRHWRAVRPAGTAGAIFGRNEAGRAVDVVPLRAGGRATARMLGIQDSGSAARAGMLCRRAGASQANRARCRRADLASLRAPVRARARPAEACLRRANSVPGRGALLRRLAGYGPLDAPTTARATCSRKEKRLRVERRARPDGFEGRKAGGRELGVPRGSRTPVAAVKGRCPGPLDDGDGFLAPTGRYPESRRRRLWWSQAGSNRRPLQCHCSALPAELWPHKGADSSALQRASQRTEPRSAVAATHPHRFAG